MKKSHQKITEFGVGFLIGLLFSGAAAALLSELKYFLERAGEALSTKHLPLFDEALSGDVVQEIGSLVYEEMKGRVGAEEGIIRERRLFRKFSESGSVSGEGFSSVYFEEE